jgi:hypothetical protein
MIEFIPYYYKGGKSVFYFPKGRFIELPIEKEKNIIPLDGKRRVIFDGEEWIITKLRGVKDKFFLERGIPPHFVIIRDYFSKFLSKARGTVPYLILANTDSDENIRMTLCDDLVNLNVIKSAVVSTEDVRSYGRPNKILELYCSFYKECKEKGLLTWEGV